MSGSLDRAEAVRGALAAVTDPELDQSVVDLDFIVRLDVAGAVVAIEFRLPTFWCSANFAWIMAEDMHEAVSALDWVANVSVRLVDHFAAGKINAGIAEREAFGTAFATEADPRLAVLRETFREKAFLARMSAVIDRLKRSGWSGDTLLALSVGELTALAGVPAAATGGGSDDDGLDLATAIARYLDLRRHYGGSAALSDPAFRTPAGERIEPAALPAFLRDIRMTRRGAEANGEMCKALLRARNAATPPAPAWSGR